MSPANANPASAESAGTPGLEAARAKPAKVWFFQPVLEHYRLPVWDGVRDAGRADGAYEIAVFGTLQADGKTTGGGFRDYLRDCPRVWIKAPTLIFHWPSARPVIEAERPDVVILSANPRNVSAWSLPGLCRRLGASVGFWSKVHSYSRVPHFFTDIMKRAFLRRYDFAILYGESSAPELDRIGFPRERVFIANNTIDTRRIFSDGDRIAARAREIRAERGLAGRKILLSIGRMEADKRTQDLLEAWPRLRELDPTLVMVLVSGGPLLEDVKSQAQRLDPERIIVTGRVPEGDDYAWIAACDLCVYPGAVGLAINQSLALARPTVIADERGADAEIVEHGRTGWRYPRGDIDAMVRTIGEVLRGGEAVARVNDAARSLMRDKVTLEHMISAIDRAIRAGLDIAGSRNRTPA
jgi:glycosyltransferase involved in cell wall biosynthesis